MAAEISVPTALERRPRLVVAASSVVSRGGLEGVIQQDPFLLRVGTASLKTVRDELAAASPDVVLLMLETGETEVMGELSALPAPPPVVVLTEELGSWVQTWLKHSVLGLLPRHADSPQILAALHAAAQGLNTLHPLFAPSLSPSAPPGPRPSMGSSLSHLTPREVEVLGMLAEGLGNKIIADRLKISEHTVKFHLSSIFSKLHAGSRTEAVTMGARLGYIVI
ncbi:MAG TPA: response regulator transcription factor [Candidatus Xenobia bacterium]